jgi:hypothetical protein
MKSTLGENHPNTLAAIANSAVDIGWIGRKNAIIIKREVLQKMRENLGELHTVTVTTTSELARSYFRKGVLREARIHSEKALRGMVEVYGDSHPDTVAEKKFQASVERAIVLRRICYFWVPEHLLK